MYSRAAFPIANLLSDVPFSACRIFIHDVVIYFMVGLDSSAGGFWTFRLFTCLTLLFMLSFFYTSGLCFRPFELVFLIVDKPPTYT